MSDTNALVAVLLTGFLGLAACGGTGSSVDQVSNPDIDDTTNRATALAMACSGCHSRQSEAVVSLDEYGGDALRAALVNYRAEADGTTVMHRLARGYTDEEVDLLTAHFHEVGVEQ